MRAHGHAQRPCEGLEDRFGLVVLVVSAGGDVEVAARGAGERMKEVTQHLGGQFTDAFAAEFGLPFEADAAPEVDERHGTAVVHGQDEAIAGDSRLAAPAHGRPPRRARCRHPRRCGARRPTGRLSLRPRVRRLRVWAICASMWSKNPIPVAMRPAPERPSRSSVSVICVSAVRRVRVDAAFAAADELGDPFPRRGDQRAGRFGAGFAQRTAARLLVGGEQDAPRPEIACQQHVGRPVADDVTGREVVASVEIAAEHPVRGLRVGASSASKVRSMSWSSKRTPSPSSVASIRSWAGRKVASGNDGVPSPSWLVASTSSKSSPDSARNPEMAPGTKRSFSRLSTCRSTGGSTISVPSRSMKSAFFMGGRF